MVFYFTTIDPSIIIYMGKNKEENEDLIRHGWPEDIWFHVDNYSSAHVYLRLKQGQTMENISAPVLEDCCQLVKANSIEGNKVNNITIVYTPWANLKKSNSMEIGQVGFHDQKQVKKYKIDTRKNEIVNRLNKTRREEYPDLAAQRSKRDKAERDKKKAVVKEQELKTQEEIEKRRKQQEQESYSDLMLGENMVSNKEIKKDYREFEDDFM